MMLLFNHGKPNMKGLVLVMMLLLIQGKPNGEGPIFS